MLGVLLASPDSSAAGEMLDAELADAGSKIVAENCARCHAIGRTGESRHRDAPPFRVVVTRYPPETLAEALAEGISTGHPDMPMFTFEPDEIGAIIAYLETLLGSIGRRPSGDAPIRGRGHGRLPRRHAGVVARQAGPEGARRDSWRSCSWTGGADPPIVASGLIRYHRLMTSKNDTAVETPRTAPLREAYARAFREFGTMALWNMRELPDPTPGDARVVARALRIEGNMAARHLAEEIERLARAAD
jgi:mono/diheme cytochrome c family protein